MMPARRTQRAERFAFKPHTKNVRSTEPTATERILRTRVELRDVHPAIWRVVEVPANLSLFHMHDILQVLMGWHDYHVWAFEGKGRHFQDPNPEWNDPARPSLSPGKVKLGELLTGEGETLCYNYDFGDNWWIELTVEAIGGPEPDVRYPRCVAGECAGPPEDCGGPPGYDELLKARKNSKTKAAKELLAWAGPGWDPDAFDLAGINKALTGLPFPRRLQ